MEQFIQVLIEVSSSFCWWHWLLGLGVAVLSGGFGIGIVFAIKEFKIWFPYLSLIFLIFAKLKAYSLSVYGACMK